jgi:hypothetical protein
MYLNVLLNQSTGGGNSEPTLVTDGVPLWKNQPGQLPNQGIHEDVDELEVLVEATVAVGTAGTVAYVQLRGWDPNAVGANKWFPIGGGAAADKGKINADAGTPFVFAETSADLIRHAERLRGIRGFTRIHAQYGTLTNISRLDVTLSSRGAVSR